MLSNSRSWMLPMLMWMLQNQPRLEEPTSYRQLEKRQGKRWWKRLAREPWLTSDKQNCFVAVVAVAVGCCPYSWICCLVPPGMSQSFSSALSEGVGVGWGGMDSLDKLVGNLDRRPRSHSIAVSWSRRFWTWKPNHAQVPPSKFRECSECYLVHSGTQYSQGRK